jgi:hypothetical protein
VNTVEDRLRAATRAAADTVPDGSAPPLTLPGPGRRGIFSRPHARRRTRWMAPIAAAAAVTAVVAGLIVAIGATSASKPHPAPAGSPASSPTAQPAVRPGPRLSDGLPAYFLAVPEGETTSRGAASGTAKIVSTATGRISATATLPGSVSRFAGDEAGLFYAAVVPRRGPVRLYRIGRPASGAVARVTALPIHAPAGGISFLAVSPNGAELAMATYVQRGSTSYVQNLTVASTTTGAERRWHTPPQDAADSIDSISWLADSQTLAFSWGSADNSASGSLRLLDTAAPGTDLLAGRSVLPLSNAAGKFADFVISGNGRVLIGTVQYPDGPFGVVDGQRVTLGDVIKFSARTGRASYLYRPAPREAPHAVTFCQDPLWVSASGRQALLTCTSSSPADRSPVGRSSESVLLLGPHGATRLPRLEPRAGQEEIAFGS